MRKSLSFVLVVLTVLAVPSFARAEKYSDLGRAPWAATAIRYTAIANEWIQVRGSQFKPTAPVPRHLLARAVVRAFPAPPPKLPDPIVVPCPEPVVEPTPSPAPDLASASWTLPRHHRWVLPKPAEEVCYEQPPAPPPPPLPKFADLTAGPLWHYAAHAVSRGLMSVGADNRFKPFETVTKAEMERVLVRALNVPDVVKALDSIATEDGRRLAHPSRFAYSIIATRLRFHFNYPGAGGMDPTPTTKISRADLAFAVRAAKQASRGGLWRLEDYKSIVLPNLDATRRKVVEHALSYAGFPYVWGGTTKRGVDCSGYVWRVLKRGIVPAEGRGYAGWPIANRRSYEMAYDSRPRIAQTQMKPMDIMMLAQGDRIGSAPWQTVGHVGLYLGNGWYIHSAGGQAGVGIDRITERISSVLLWADRVIP